MNRKAEEKWGTGIVEQLSLDLQAAFPNETGFGTSNLWYMKKWYLFYDERLQRLVGEINTQDATILQRLVGELYDIDNKLVSDRDEYAKDNYSYALPSLFASVPWGQHIEIISRCKSLEEAVFYLRLTVAESLSRPALLNCIKSDVYHKRGAALTNFTDKLPMPQAELAQDITRSNYNFGFIKLPYGFNEKQLEDALCNQMTRFLLELGNGFAFMGRQKELVVSGVSRRIDLLFYHIRLRSYIVLEIKARPFDPSFAGQINFYVNAVDEILKNPEDNPTIGLLICSDMRDTDVQLSFKGITTPLGVATYNNVQLEEIKRQLPTYNQLVERVRLLEHEISKSKE